MKENKHTILEDVVPRYKPWDHHNGPHHDSTKEKSVNRRQRGGCYGDERVSTVSSFHKCVVCKQKTKNASSLLRLISTAPFYTELHCFVLC